MKTAHAHGVLLRRARALHGPPERARAPPRAPPTRGPTSRPAPAVALPPARAGRGAPPRRRGRGARRGLDRSCSPCRTTRGLGCTDRRREGSPQEPKHTCCTLTSWVIFLSNPIDTQHDGRRRQTSNCCSTREEATFTRGKTHCSVGTALGSPKY